MWLINTETFGLEEFANYPKHAYAILSHRWEENEVNFEDWKGRKYVQRKGYLKIMRFVQKAAEQGFKYAWADTCCINKDSSAKLSEVINSMFKYYQDAAKCYVYLSDLPPLCPSDKLDVTNPLVIGDDDSRNTIFANSKWFTRGWTLQEMIAPRTLQFFDSAWYPFGTKHGLAAIIESRTGVPKEILDGFQQLKGTSIACRMSWAADRQMTRAEDLAYCLLGIFDIHLPLLYGEGEAAFIRLQEEICRKTTDMSLFAWTTLLPDHQYSVLLARSPSNFRKSANVACWSSALQTDFNDEIAVTNRGIRFDNITLYISSQYGILLELNCWNYIEEGQLGYVFICLSQAPASWVRCRASEIVYMADGTLPSLKSLHLSRIFICTTMEPELYDHRIFSATPYFSSTR